jgi:aspartokinase
MIDTSYSYVHYIDCYSSRPTIAFNIPLILQEKKWVVQKHGGTSLGKLLPAITGTIIPQYLRTQKIAVICSAISGTSKSMGTTSLLLKTNECAMCHYFFARSSELSARSKDRVVATGEKIACRLVVASLMSGVSWPLDPPNFHLVL